MTVDKQNLLPVCSGHLEFALFLSECLNGISKYIAVFSADNSSQYQLLSSQTGACSARHSLRPQTTVKFYIIIHHCMAFQTQCSDSQRNFCHIHVFYSFIVLSCTVNVSSTISMIISGLFLEIAPFEQWPNRSNLTRLL